MMRDAANVHAESGKAGRIRIPASHGKRKLVPDPPFESEMAAYLRENMRREEIQEAFTWYGLGSSRMDVLMRRVCLRALVKSMGNGVTIKNGATFAHPETIEIGDGVYFGENAIIQGRIDGYCYIGKGAWIGPQCFLDVRNLMIGEFVGIGPGVRVLGSEHTAEPTDVPIIQTDLDIEPVRIEAWADIGMSAVVLPGVTVGQGAVIGAGAVVVSDVPPFCTAVGVPAKVMSRREKGNAVSGNPRMPVG